MTQLIDIGTCGLHMVHNSFKHGSVGSKWKIQNLLHSMYKIFHESPSRRADFERLTSASEQNYPLQFVWHRWIENADVAKRAIIVWSKVMEVVKYWQTLLKSKQPGNQSYAYLVTLVKATTFPRYS